MVLTQLKIRQLQKRKQEEEAAKGAAGTENVPSNLAKVSAAQLRLQKDVTELDLPRGIKVSFPDPSDIFNFDLTIVPQENYYKGGKFSFQVEINNNFPIDPPKIKCKNKIYHPNIDLEGNVCLNILREDWSPVLNLNSVLMGLNFLFLEPNPNDPLNKDAANMLVKNKPRFAMNVSDLMRGGSLNGEYYDRVI